MRQIFRRSRSKSARNVKRSSWRRPSFSRSYSDSSISATPSSPSVSPLPPTPDVWDLTPRKKLSTVGRKLEEEQQLCRKYESCGDYKRMFCSNLSTLEKQELEDFIAFAKRKNFLSSHTSPEDMKTICETWQANQYQ